MIANDKTSNRIDWIDKAKGIGILLVLLGHTNCPEIMKQIIYMFHMPLFFIISGYLWNDKIISDFTPPQYIRKKVKSYIIPYLKIASWCFLCFAIIMPVLQGQLFTIEWQSKVVKYVYGIFIFSRGTVEYLPNCSPIWFLTCLFCAELYFYFLMRFVANPKCRFLCIVLIGMVSYVSMQGPKLWWNMDNALIACVFIYMGYSIRAYKIMYIKWGVIIAAIISIFLYGLPLCDYDGNRISPVWQSYLVAVGMTLVVFDISKSLHSNFLSYCGRHTLFLFGYNYFWIFLCHGILSMVGVYNYIILFLLVTFLSLTSAYLLNKYPFFYIKKYFY